MDENIPTDLPVMGVVITNTKADGMSTPDAVRRAWRLGERQLAKANEARYVLAIERGTVVDIFEKHGNFTESSEEGRYSFRPVPVTDPGIRRKYIGKRCHPYGAAVVFFGFQNSSQEQSKN